MLTGRVASVPTIQAIVLNSQQKDISFIIVVLLVIPDQIR